MGSIAISAVVALSVAELFLSRFHPIAGLTYRIDERTLMGSVPGARKLFIRSAKNGGDRILVSFDRDGFRGRELESDRAELRVAVYGDSFVESEFSTDEHSFAGRLELELSRLAGRKIRTVNAGLVGYGTDQALLRMEGDLETVAPHLVVLALTGNDFGDLMQNKLFRLAPDGALESNPFVISPQFRSELAPHRGLERFHLVRGLEGLAADVRARFRPAEPPIVASDAWLKTYVDDALASLEHDYLEHVVWRRTVVYSTLGDYWDADMSLRPDSDSARYKVALMLALLRRAEEFLATRGIPLLLVAVPAALDACPAYDYGVDRNRFPAYVPSRLTDIASALADRTAIPRVNLFPVFGDHDPCSLYFRDGDDHWNDAGQELAARFVADRIIADRLLEPR